MKRTLYILWFLLLLPNVVFSHSGGTDANGGHTCRTNCEKYGLEYGEYHYHGGGPPAIQTDNVTVEKSSVPTPQKDVQVAANVVSNGVFLGTTEYMGMLALLVAALIYFVYRKDKAGIWIMVVLLGVAIGFYVYGENRWISINNYNHKEIESLTKQIEEKDTTIKQQDGDIAELQKRIDDLFADLGEAEREKQQAEQKAVAVASQLKSSSQPKTTPKVTPKATGNINDIKPGMTYEEVVAVMGREGTLQSSYPSLGDKYRWNETSGGYGHFFVTFKDGKVSSIFNLGY